MLPSLLARDIQQGIKQFLITGFEPADGFFHGVMRRFVDNEPAWMKGPYLQVGLPFRHDSAGRDFFQRLPDRTPRLHAPARGLAAPGERPDGGAHPGRHRHGQRQNGMLCLPRRWTTARGRGRPARAASRRSSSTR